MRTNVFSWEKCFVISLKCALWVHMTLNPHWFVYWLVTEHKKKHHLNQWWPISMNFNCVTRRSGFTHWPGHGRFSGKLEKVIFKFISGIYIWNITREIASWWMAQDLLDQSRVVQAMAWCRQASSLFLGQWWPKSMSPYGVSSLRRPNRRL